MKSPDKIRLVSNLKKEISMAQPVTPPRIQQAPVEPGAPARPERKLVSLDKGFKSARVLVFEPAAGAPQAAASTIKDIAAKVIPIR